MRYVIANWVHSDDGFQADLPEGLGYTCLAGSSRAFPFGLFGISEFPDASDKLMEVPQSLSVLLDSSSSFPPALALAQDEINRQKPMAVVEFVAEMERLLRERLEQQKSCPYCLIRSKIDEIGYRSKGEFVWIVGLGDGPQNVSEVLERDGIEGTKDAELSSRVIAPKQTARIPRVRSPQRQNAPSEVIWVSSIYQLYSAAVESFDVEPSWLQERFA